MHAPTQTDSHDARDGALTYSYKPSLMGSPHQFRLEDDGLYWDLGRHHGRIKYSDIRRVRLSFRPVTLQNYRFIAEIWSEGIPKLQMASTSVRNIVEQERHDAAYAAFVRALHQRIAAAGATPLLYAGSTPWIYWPGFAVFAGLALLLPYMLTKALLSGSWAGAAVVAALLAAFAWQIGSLFWRNRPATYSIDAVPSRVLPRG